MRSQLEQAVHEGLLSPDQIQPLTLFLEDNLDISALPGSAYQTFNDNERINFVGGFNDIFVSIGIMMLCGASFFLFLQFSQDFNQPLFLFLNSLVFCMLSELFTKRHRLALSSSLLSLCFVTTSGLFFFNLLGINYRNVTEEHPFIIIAAGLWTAGTVYFHYYRYRVDIDICLMAMSFLASVFILAKRAVISFGNDPTYGYVLTGSAGLAVLAAALYFDSRDPLRKTQNADIAFWLHLLAAPLIVNSFFWISRIKGMYTFSHTSSEISFLFSILGILILFSIFAVTAIIIDRRAMLVSGLSYCGYAVYNAAERLSASPKPIAIAMALFFLGLGIVFLGYFWQPIREKLLRLLVPEKLLVFLPPA